jgi:hypothetical protein
LSSDLSRLLFRNPKSISVAKPVPVHAVFSRKVPEFGCRCLQLLSSRFADSEFSPKLAVCKQSPGKVLKVHRQRYMSARSALGNFQLCGRSNFRLGLQMDADFRGDSQPEKEFSGFFVQLYT